MLAAERRSLILERLERDGSVLVASLSSEFGVSEETIRRDLEKLEKSGFAERKDQFTVENEVFHKGILIYEAAC